MQTHDDVYLDGRWVAAHGGRRTEVENPATEEIWASVPDGDAVDVDRAVRAARSALPGWSSRSASERAGFLRRLADEIEERASELARLTTTENGTPIAETGGSSRWGDDAPANGRPRRAHRRPRPATQPDGSRLQRGARRPVGMAGLITPWNFPLSLVIVKLAPACSRGAPWSSSPARRPRWRSGC